MSIAIQVTLKGDAPAAVRAVALAIRPERLQPIVGRSATKTIRDHLFGLNLTRPNQLGGPRTNFYSAAARDTHFDIVGDSVIVSINQVGMAQRYFGGTITAGKGISSKSGKPTQFLAIPVAPEAHGKRPSEFKDLEVVFGLGGRPIGLATKSTRAVQLTENARGKLVKKSIGRYGVLLFRLVRSVTQKPDETVLPYDEVIARDIEKSVNAVVDRACQRAEDRFSQN